MWSGNFYTSIGTDKQLPIIDDEFAYNFIYSHKTYLLLVWNTIHLRTMKKNLLPPFIIRESGIKVNNMQKIHVDDI